MGNFSEKYDLKKAKLLKQLIEKSYKKGNFTLSSGKKSSHYLNCKPVSLNGEGLNLKKDTYWIMCLADILDLHKPPKFGKTKSVEVFDLLLKKGLVIG